MIKTIVQIEKIKDFDEQGFYSKTYLGRDTRLNRFVAVKDIIPENLTSEEDFERYFEEANRLSFAAHPRVLPVYYVGLDHSNGDEVIPRIVTCFFKNGSLNKLLEQTYASKRTLSLDESIRFAHDIIQGMIHLHSLDIVHLDLKASNIYIGDDYKMVIGDFGQSKFIKGGIVHERVSLYPAIAPVEASSKKALDKTTDIYQFGLLLYSILCYDKYRFAIDEKFKISTNDLKKIYRDKPANVDELKAQFKGNMKLFVDALKKSEFPKRDDYPIYVPQKLQNIIHKCIDPDVANRYHDFYEIQADLNDFIFPDGVSGYYQDLTTNNIHFTKGDRPCIISISQQGDKHEIKSTKNGRAVSQCCEENVTPAMLPRKILTFAKDI